MTKFITLLTAYGLINKVSKFCLYIFIFKSQQNFVTIDILFCNQKAYRHDSHS
ncbi:hypothetical protein AO365_1605 [Moraxella catarrhalis]|nr:hypothetical protein AO365_1605 [Moraxella catarrhalis]